MALPYQHLGEKLKLVDGTYIRESVPSFDDWEHMGTSFADSYREGTSLEAGLEGRAMTLRSYGPTEENHLRQYHVDESRNKKREKRAQAQRSIRSR